MQGSFVVNGQNITVSFRSKDTLLRLLRKNGYTEVKEGCGEGECGSCVVLVDGKLVNACHVFAASVMDREITTVRGLGDVHSLHPIQTAMVERGAVQCGFCTPGFVLAAYYLLKTNPDPKEEDIRRGLDGNLCRCTGYVKIIEAVKLAAKRMRGNG
jgi:aerobic-type carbon monoxide dehydrogenase small subunit (CoxS/CutS family)